MKLLIQPTLETIYMVVLSSFFALIIGLITGILLFLTPQGGIYPKPTLYRLLDGVVNVLRSFPFIILMILLFPLSRVIVGTTIGTTATIIPLAIGAAPFVGRVAENALKEVDAGTIEAVMSMGATNFELVTKALLPEALPSLILGMSLTVINIIGYSAMAGAIGGGGLGDLAIRFGFHRFQTDVMIAAVVVIILLVQGTQWLGNFAAGRILEKRSS
jgi:D-methionine transport system permease protein